jgi:hypothetical protein
MTDAVTVVACSSTYATKGGTPLGIGTSLFLITIGAILAFAVDVDLQVIDLRVTGLILAATGVVGLGLAIAFWQSWWGGWPTFSRRSEQGDPQL